MQNLVQKILEKMALCIRLESGEKMYPNHTDKFNKEIQHQWLTRINHRMILLNEQLFKGSIKRKIKINLMILMNLLKHLLKKSLFKYKKFSNKLKNSLLRVQRSKKPGLNYQKGD